MSEASEHRLARRSLRSLVVVLVLALAVVCALQLSASVTSARAGGRTARLADLSAMSGTLAYQLEAERDETAWLLASNASKSQLRHVHAQYRLTDRWAREVRAGLSTLGPGYPVSVLLDARSARTELGLLASVRHAAQAGQATPLAVVDRYSATISALLDFNGQLARSSTDPRVISTASAAGMIERAEDEYSLQRGVVAYGLTAGAFAPKMLSLLEASMANWGADNAQFQNFASPSQLDLYKGALAGNSMADRISASEQAVIRDAHTHTTLTALGISPAQWFSIATAAIGRVRSVGQRLTAAIRLRGRDQRRTAITAAVTFSVLIALLAAGLAAVIRPWIGGLRRGAASWRVPMASERRATWSRS
ncbi:MAG TPA: nitrate- and nitrite sensing domain-containing protein [Streptosporangiaceae bacterium]|nr:nitrate- and nitrite sensing domain-containing protein [Streptosporangiaceae bacterium]